MKANLEHEDMKQSDYSAYISRAEYDLHRPLTVQFQYGRYPHERPRLEAGDILQPFQAAPGIHLESELLQSAVEVGKMPPTPARQTIEPKPKPWNNLSDPPKGLNFQPPPELHAKMNWVCDNVPKMSRLRILREGAELLCNQLIAKYYKE